MQAQATRLTTPAGNLLEDAVQMTTKKTAEKPALAGIKPDTPAPTPAPAKIENASASGGSGGGLIGFFKRLFSSSADTETSSVSSKSRAQTSGSNNDRGSNSGTRQKQRNRRERSGERDSNERGKRGERGERSASNRNNTKKTGTNRPQRPLPANSAEAPNTTVAADDRSANTENADTTRKRRRRRRPDSKRASDQSTGPQVDRPEATGDAGATAEIRDHSADNRDNRSEVTAQPAISPLRTSENPVSQLAVTEIRPERSTTPVPSASSQNPEAGGLATKPAVETSRQAEPQTTPASEKTVPSSIPGDRLLPWESPAQQDKTYRVWSSDETPKQD